MPDFPLKNWYSMNEAKRKLGALAQALNEKEERVGIAGSADAPKFFLQDVDLSDLDGSEQHLGVDQLRTAWSDKLEEVRKSGSLIVVEGSRKPRAVLFRNEALAKIRKSVRKSAVLGQTQKFEAILGRLDELAGQLQSAANKVEADAAFYRPILTRLDERLEVVDRRFAELWKSQNG